MTRETKVETGMKWGRVEDERKGAEIWGYGSRGGKGNLEFQGVSHLIEREGKL